MKSERLYTKPIMGYMHYPQEMIRDFKDRPVRSIALLAFILGTTIGGAFLDDAYGPDRSPNPTIPTLPSDITVPASSE